MAFKFFESKEELLSGTQYDYLTNDDIGDIIGFTEKVNELERNNKISFTKSMDRGEDLADLFRLCVAQYQKGNDKYSFYEYSEKFLLNMERKFKAPITITEVCPNCEHEIIMEVPQGTEKINFCPYCGEKDVLLCSECINEIGDCQPSAHCAYCHGHPHTFKD